MLAMAVVMTWGAAAWGFEDDEVRTDWDRTYQGRSVILRSGPGAVDDQGGVFARDPGSGNLIDTRSGSVFVPAGPNGYIDTRTGQFHPAN